MLLQNKVASLLVFTCLRSYYFDTKCKILPHNPSESHSKNIESGRHESVDGIDDSYCYYQTHLFSIL